MSCFLCDAPARAFLKRTKGHTGYFGCERCMQEGVYVNGRVTFPDVASANRTDADFRSMANEENRLF